ncbi:MAG TPA: mannose-1-phosphate guanyltransferase, partial [Streptosporangiaceae bacterium]|nr:mannose-1-phosphate guanyltransferase [Streptosporangiaceae bacterium]
EPEAYLSAGVKVYPFKTIEAGAVVNTSVIWESRGQRTLFGPRGVSGLVNVEVTPELAVRLASAYATMLRKGSTVTTSRDVSRAARALKRAVQGALNASAINVVDLEAQPLPVVRFETARDHYSGGIAIRTTPGDPQSVDIIFLNERGAELSQADQRKLERVFSRQEYRRAFPGEIAELSYSHRVVESYTHELLRCVDMSGVSEANLKVVADCAGGTTSLVLPSLLGTIEVGVLTLNNRLDEISPTETVAQQRAGLQRLAEMVSSSQAAFGVRFDPVGERIQLVDEKGELVSEDRALLSVLDLVAAERKSGRVALPVTTTRVAEQVCRFHGVQVTWTPTSMDALTLAAASEDVIFAADGRGGFVVPECARTVDGIAAFVRLLGLVARTRLTLSQIDARIPVAHMLKRSIPTPWAAKGSVMRTVVEAAGSNEIDTTDGVRVVVPDRGWILALPDPAEAVTHLWAEGDDADNAQLLMDEWAEVVEQAGR